MAISTKQKQKIIKDFGGSETNTGSVETQIALLTSEINDITKHIVKNPKDFSTKRGLFIKVSRRKSLLGYLQKKDIDKYRELIKKLELRG